MFRETGSGVKTDRSRLRKALDGFLNARGIFENDTQSDLDRERQSVDQLGL